MKHNGFWLWLGIALALPAGMAMAGPAPDAPQAPTATRWMFIPASSFVPRSSNSIYDYHSGACVSAATGVTLVHKLLPPNGANLRYMRLYYLDNSGATRMSGFVSSYDAAGTLTDLTQVRSSNRGDYSSSLSPDINHIVDRVDTNYAINLRFESDSDSIFVDSFETAPTMRFCGVRMMWDE